MKAIIELGKKGNIFGIAREQLATGRARDYRLSFESARMLFSELTPARLDLINTLRQTGPCSVYALAKAAGRNYSNVHTDVARLLELGLVERRKDDTVFVPFDEIDIRLPLPAAA
jgi:predicted transcriptional regulator